MKRRHKVIVFAKVPRLGASKTRLARDIGRFPAWLFSRHCGNALTRWLERQTPWHVSLCITPDSFVGHGRFWPARRGQQQTRQGRGDIGVRMARASQRRNRLESWQSTLLIGSDIPGLTPHHLAAGFRMLRRVDFVFGPASDGGFWLVGFSARARAGLNRPERSFRNVRWSSRHTLADALAALPKGVSVGFLPVLDDIDDGLDYRRWKNRFKLPAGAE